MALSYRLLLPLCLVLSNCSLGSFTFPINYDAGIRRDFAGADLTGFDGDPFEPIFEDFAGSVRDFSSGGGPVDMSTGGGPVDLGPIDPGLAVPPIGQSSNGSGGAHPRSTSGSQGRMYNYIINVPSGYQGSPFPLMIVYSGQEGAVQMSNNLSNLGGCSDKICVILDGRNYNMGNHNGGATDGAALLDQMRSQYNVDNDRTYLLSESAGTLAGYVLGYSTRQSYFAAYWANDISGGTAAPVKNAAQLGFRPWGQVGPGGQQTNAQTMVSDMRNQGYQLDNVSPFQCSGTVPPPCTHGETTQQFPAAVQWFDGKSRN